MAEKRWMVAERHKNENNNIFSRIIILCRKQCEQHAMSSKRTLGIHASVERANCTMTYIIFFFNFISDNMLIMVIFFATKLLPKITLCLFGMYKNKWQNHLNYRVNSIVKWLFLHSRLYKWKRDKKIYMKFTFSMQQFKFILLAVLIFFLLNMTHWFWPKKRCPLVTKKKTEQTNWCTQAKTLLVREKKYILRLG